MKDFASQKRPRPAAAAPQPSAAAEKEGELRCHNLELERENAELREINKSLTDSEQRLRLAIATGQIGLWVWNSTDVTNAGDWSPRLKEIFGLPLETEVTHEIFLNRVHPGDRERVNTAVMQALSGAHAGEYVCQYRIIRADDQAPRWVTARGQAFFDAQGTPVRFIGTIMDITERKLGEESIEEKLRQSEAYLAEAQRLSRTGSFGWNVATGEFVWSNETFCILGYERTVKPTLELVFKRVHPEDIAFVRRTLDRATREETNLNFEHRLLMADGSIKHVHVLAELAKTAAGEMEFIGAVMDITEQKRNEEALRRNEAYQAEAQKLSQTGSFCIRVASQELISSEETVRIGGWPPGTKPSVEQALERVHPDDRLRVQTTLEKALQDGRLLEYEHRLLLPDGSVRHVHTVANSMRDASGEVEFVGAVMDITEKKKNEDALNAAKARFQGILEIADDAIISTNSDQRIVLFNQGAEKVFGYTSSEVVGQSLDLLLPKRFAHAHKEQIEAFARSSEVSRSIAQRREVLGRRKDGHEFPAEACISKLELGDETIFTVILRDITQRKHAAEALKASEHLARGQVEALTNTLAALSKQSEPEKFFELVLATIVRQLDAHSLGVYERNGNTGQVRLLANHENGHPYIATSEESEASSQFGIASRYHPVWTEFFRTGAHCVIGNIQSNTVYVRSAEAPDSPWYDWSPDTAVVEPVKVILNRIQSDGVVSTLVVPTFVAGKVTGLISIRFKGQRFLRSEEIELARALTHQATLAIRLIRLSQQSREAAVIAERNRLARDIHDMLAQGFTGVIMQLEAAKGAAACNDNVEVSKRIARAGDLARSSLGEARRSVRALRPRSLRDGTLCMALEDLLERMSNGTGLNAEFRVEGEPQIIPVDWEESLLRIAQESLTNTIKHAGARNFRATLRVNPESVELHLADDGDGFDLQGDYDGFGLVGMRERAGQIGGRFDIRSKPGQGTEVVVTLKYPAAPKSKDQNEKN